MANRGCACVQALQHLAEAMAHLRTMHQAIWRSAFLVMLQQPAGNAKEKGAKPIFYALPASRLPGGLPTMAACHHVIVHKICLRQKSGNKPEGFAFAGHAGLQKLSGIRKLSALSKTLNHGDDPDLPLVTIVLEHLEALMVALRCYDDNMEFARSER